MFKTGQSNFYFKKWLSRLFILYELDTWLQDLNADFTLKECLFEVVKLTKTPDPDKYYSSGYGLVYLNHIFCQFFYNVFE